jgi:hypothetical protein
MEVGLLTRAAAKAKGEELETLVGVVRLSPAGWVLDVGVEVTVASLLAVGGNHSSGDLGPLASEHN